MKRVRIINGNIWNGLGQAPFMGSLLLEKGIIREVRPQKNVENPKDFPEEVVDARGGTVIPAFTDSHFHCSAYARQKLGVNLSETHSLEEAVQLLRKASQERDPKEWIYGIGLNENNWDIPRLPQGKDFKDIPQPLLIMRICCHIHIANPKAMEEIGPMGPEIPGVCRDSHGNPTGVFEENAARRANELFEQSLRQDGKFYKALGETFRECLSLGIGEIHPIGAGGIGLSEDLRDYQNFRDQGKLPLRTVFYFDGFPTLPISSGLGDPWIAYGGLKLFLDGSLGGRTAALSEPYTDGKGRGVLLYTHEALEEVCAKAAGRDLQVMVHAIGDRAVSQLLDVLESLKDKGIVWKYPFKATHMEVCSPKNVQRAGKLGLFCDMQPHQIASDAVMAPRRLGAERSLWVSPMKSLMEAGATLVGTSDCPVEPLNPLSGIWAALARTSPEGFPPGGWNPRERLNLDEALSMYTCNPAKLTLRHSWKGTLAPGQGADITVFSENLMDKPLEEIKECTVQTTLVDGVVRFDREKGFCTS